MIDINIKGTLFMLKTFLPGMRQRNSGHVINVSSIAGTETTPLSGVFSATKHALNAITDTIRMELADTKVRVSSISPGAIESHKHCGSARPADNCPTPLLAKDVGLLQLLFDVSHDS